MVQGVSSNAGKSLLVTALCRWSRRHGMDVAPFKAQNMSNNARVVDGGEIGTAQWLQARAAGVGPDVRMNPVLLKPESDTTSQVVVRGVVDHELTAAPWRDRSARLWPVVTEALSSLADEFDVLIIEGAGSPAETNLWASDIVNMAVADYIDAPVALVADVDRGGAFAHLFGTWALLPPAWQRRIEGFVLNKFRGDPGLLAPAPRNLETACGVPTVGVIPWLDHHLPAEEGPTVLADPGTGRRVSIVCGPYASNLDEFVQLQQVARVTWVRSIDGLGGADLIILPGSKHVAGDLAWLRRSGMAQALVLAAQGGTPVLGICGGLQMLGHRVEDLAGVDGLAEGLGLLPVVTRYHATKRTVHTSTDFGPLAAPWSWLSDQKVSGYEIRHGSSHATARMEIDRDGIAFGQGNVLGLTMHGVLEDPDVLESFTGAVPAGLDRSLDLLADAVDEHLDTAWLEARLTPHRRNSPRATGRRPDGVGHNGRVPVPADSTRAAASSWDHEDRVEHYLDRRAGLVPRRAGEEVLISLLPPAPHSLLDLGCGDGRLARLALDARASLERVVAVDSSPPMLDRARHHFADDQRVTVRPWDMTRSIGPLGPFDVIVSGFAIHHLEDDRKQGLFGEVAAQLGPGGLFANLEVVTSATPELHAEFMRHIGRSGDDPEDRLADVEAQLNWMRRAGMTQVDCVWRWRGFALLVGRGPDSDPGPGPI
jgi:adenosylcobyric acid synthase